VWQKANHLITRKGQLRTEVENFNLIFSADDARERLTRGFFAIIPLLSFHSLQIIEGVMAQFARRAAPHLIPLRTAAGMLLWLSSEASYLELDDERHKFEAVVTRTIREMRCVQCDKRIAPSGSNVRSLFREGAVTCRGRGYTINFRSDDA
jgi:hypothetical protein